LKQYNIDGFIKLVENNEFVEAHEVLEDEWKALKKSGGKENC
jgi:predicted metal-dependent hydrolase